MLKEKHLKLFNDLNEEDQKCRFCFQKISAEDAVVTYSYWRGFIFFCHQDCKKAGETEERKACQIIDADCNDCFFFQRGSVISKGTYEGLCRFFGERTIAHPLMGTGHYCFEHRDNKIVIEEMEK